MIEIKNVNKFYGDNKVLKNVNLTIEDGEIFGIIGTSGAGKSTLLRCINRLEEFQDGEIIVNNYSVGQLDEKKLRLLRKDTGMIFQHFSLLERKTVFENVSLPMECFNYSKEEIKKRVDELLMLVGIFDKKNEKPRNLSGGQKQRVAIARALTMNPSVLLCDEATSALDPKTTRDILELLETINKEFGITIIMVTHQMEVIKSVCGRTAIMEGGKIVEVGDTAEIFLSNSSSVKRLLGEEDIVLPEGINLRLLFGKDVSKESLITSMARELQIDVSIIYGKLEKFRNDILGSLVINISECDLDKVENYLHKSNMRWEVL